MIANHTKDLMFFAVPSVVIVVPDTDVHSVVAVVPAVVVERDDCLLGFLGIMAVHALQQLFASSLEHSTI